MIIDSVTSKKNENRFLIDVLSLNPATLGLDLRTAKRLDWKYILEIAAEHRVTPAIFQNINKEFADVVPKDVFDEFKKRHNRISKFNFARTAQLIKLVALLKDNSIPVISYKGMALAQFAYGDISRREFTDIDLFIRKKDFPRAKRLLADIECLPAWKLTKKQEKAALKYHYEIPFFYGESKLLVEIHWEFVESFFAFDYDLDELWKRSQTVQLCGREIPTLTSEDYLIVLSAHGSKHYWKRLSWILDIARLVQNTEIDWQKLSQRAAAHGSLRMVRLALAIAENLLSLDLPSSVSKEIAEDKAVTDLCEKTKRRIFSSEKEPSDWKEMARMHLSMRERKRDKFKYSRRLFTTKLVDSLFLPIGRPR